MECLPVNARASASKGVAYLLASKTLAYVLEEVELESRAQIRQGRDDAARTHRQDGDPPEGEVRGRLVVVVEHDGLRGHRFDHILDQRELGLICHGGSHKTSVAVHTRDTHHSRDKSVTPSVSHIQFMAVCTCLSVPLPC